MIVVEFVWLLNIPTKQLVVYTLYYSPPDPPFRSIGGAAKDIQGAVQNRDRWD